MKYEILDTDGNIINTIIADQSFAESNFEHFREVSETTLEPVIRIITKLAFRNRLTMAEKTAIYTAAESNIQIRIWLDDLSSAEEADLDFPELKAGLEAMVSGGLLTADRVAEILQ